MTAQSALQTHDQSSMFETEDRPERPGIPKLAPALLLIMAALATPASGQTMTLEEMQAELEVMQAKMQQMQAMQLKMEQMEKELKLLRERDAARQAETGGQLVTHSDTSSGTSQEVLPSTAGAEAESDAQIAKLTTPDTQAILDTMPIAPLGRGEQLNDPDFKKSVPLFGSDYRFSIGGYAKTDLIFDFDGVGDPYEFVLGAIPVNDSPQGGSYSKLGIRESRTNLEIRSMNSRFPIDKFFLEFDFWDGAENTNFRLRHAYMQYGQLLAGRTWSIITELRALPLIMDFAAGDAILGGRSEQIKWDGDKIFGALDWAIGLEAYDDTRIVTPDTLEGRGLARADAPRLSGGLSYPWDHGVLSVGGAVNEVRFDGTDGLGDESELGWSAVLGSRIYLDPDNQHFLGFNAGYTNGTVADIIAFANDGTPNAALDENGNLDLAEGWNANIGMHLNLPGKFSTNLHYAYTKLEEIPELFAPDEMAEAWAAHVNLIYDFDPRFRVGMEYMWGERQIVSGDDGDASRLQFSTFYYY
ncbi:hypothetical protein E4634_18740 [Mangrovimicrobium sediminis]|uniref:Porin n=1 Tax=Mangrovimicrobium sediminis TaxID=2562682 RepID=A0A4Z0LVL1_9GAMM|nr:DcaP family trimeric outer membrane transporter [Haliea sp. SAOS-164]TGD71310.1 hypothetical protein E4634_18740 [Haliea sp. SAOS-164]